MKPVWPPILALLFQPCPRCGRSFRCQCGYVTVGLIIAGVIAAAGAAYGAYSASEAQQQQASMAKKAAQNQADAEQAAGEARAKQIQYNADKLHRSFLSREAGAGVQVGQGSLLETEGQFAFDTEYSKQLAKYPHELAGQADQYQADLFGFQKKQAASNEAGGIAMAGVTSAAGSATKVYSSLASAGKSPSGGIGNSSET